MVTKLPHAFKSRVCAVPGSIGKGGEKGEKEAFFSSTSGTAMHIPHHPFITGRSRQGRGGRGGKKWLLSLPVFEELLVLLLHLPEGEKEKEGKGAKLA